MKHTFNNIGGGGAL